MLNPGEVKTRWLCDYIFVLVCIYLPCNLNAGCVHTTSLATRKSAISGKMHHTIRSQKAPQQSRLPSQQSKDFSSPLSHLPQTIPSHRLPPPSRPAVLSHLRHVSKYIGGALLQCLISLSPPLPPVLLQSRQPLTIVEQKAEAKLYSGELELEED